MKSDLADRMKLGRRLHHEVLDPMKSAFVGKDEIIDLMGVCLVAGENLFILGPPGTAKSALVQELSRRIDGKVFDYLLTRFTEPNELFGPFDIRKLREGDLVTNTEGMLPEAEFVFLDELLNANSAILNSLLMVLNERVFRRGRERRKLPTLMVVGASNRLPDDEALNALFDRFLLRIHSGNVGEDRLGDVLAAGWQLDRDATERGSLIDVETVQSLQRMINSIRLDAIRPKYVDLIGRLRRAGILISDRRAVKLQRLIAASAILCGRDEPNPTDFWIFRYIWDQEEQQEVLRSIVQTALEQVSDDERSSSHPCAFQNGPPDSEELAHDLHRIEESLNSTHDAVAVTILRDQLSHLSARCQWVRGEQERAYLDQILSRLWERVGETL